MKKEILKKTSKLKDEFKDFALKGATIGTAVGIMLGGALGSVINSLVKDILTPPIAYLTSGLDFSNLYIVLGRNTYATLQEAQTAGAAIIYYGNFINAFISFVITALALFFFVYKITQWLTREKKEEKKEI